MLNKYRFFLRISFYGEETEVQGEQGLSPESLGESEGKLGLELSDLALSISGCCDSGCPSEA